MRRSISIVIKKKSPITGDRYCEIQSNLKRDDLKSISKRAGYSIMVEIKKFYLRDPIQAVRMLVELARAAK